MDKFSVFDRLDEGIQVISPKMEYVYINKSAAQQGKSTVEELKGAAMKDKYPGIEKTAMYKLLKEAMKNKEIRSMENKFQFPDGSEGFFELRFIPVNEGMLIISFDVTDRVKLENRLLDLERQHGKSTDNLPGTVARSIMEEV